ncbi:MAG: UDP-N-acetylmuramate--L-alanine ligase [Lachnospiraceae bacterium]|nr:UDP-N-acetylmuramate--L-alanine ligase [Lachnospiraceae bacterium]
MYLINFDKPVHVHFIGIGGISMSGLAQILLNKGFTVSGSDSKESPLTAELTENGAEILIGQKASNINTSIDVVVYTAAIRKDNPEFDAAVKMNIPMLTRAELLGQIMRNYASPIAVSGTHGKTTTSSMASEILLAADTDPTLSIGGILKSIDGNIRIGDSDYFLTEACEYTNSFLSFYPKYGVILNIEEDHLDFFKDINDIRASFKKFAELLPADGVLIINKNIDNLDEIIKGLCCKTVTFGTDSDADYYATDIRLDSRGCYGYTFNCPDGRTSKVQLSVVGIHNVYNSLAAMALSDILGIPDSVSTDALRTYSGADRRFEFKGSVGGVNIIDDYAHHPTEIKATLTAAKDYPHEHLWCVFQPHTYTRTKAFLHDFAEALSLAENVVLADIYAARETDTLGISSADLQEEIIKLGGNCHYFRSFGEIEIFLLQNCNPGDMLITMGAGDVVKIGENLLGN